MKICRTATRNGQYSLTALTLIAGLFLLPPERVTGQGGSGEQPENLSGEQLDKLVGPIALYPDKLVAIILPASTYPLEVVQADRLLTKNKKMSEDAIKKLDFETSILALMHYPEVLTKMNKDLDWTTMLGDAVANQQEEVMAAIQRFRAKAQGAGNLVSNEQVVYKVEDSTISIVSASPTVIYVPAYDPQVVVVQRAYPSPVVTFASGVAIGAWLSQDCNWRNYHIDVDIHGARGYWGGHRYYGNIHGGVWGPNAGRRAAARTGARAGARAGYRTGTRQGYRSGYRAGQRSNVPRTGAAGGARGTGGNRADNRSANRDAGNRGNNRSADRGAGNRGNNRSADRGSGNRGNNRSADRGSGNRGNNRSTTRRSGGKAYGGYKSGRSARSNSSRGSRSRGGGGSRGGGRRGGGRR